MQGDMANTILYALRDIPEELRAKLAELNVTVVVNADPSTVFSSAEVHQLAHEALRQHAERGNAHRAVIVIPAPPDLDNPAGGFAAAEDVVFLTNGCELNTLAPLKDLMRSRVELQVPEFLLPEFKMTDAPTHGPVRQQGPRSRQPSRHTSKMQAMAAKSRR